MENIIFKLPKNPRMNRCMLKGTFASFLVRQSVAAQVPKGYVISGSNLRSYLIKRKIVALVCWDPLKSKRFKCDCRAGVPKMKKNRSGSPIRSQASCFGTLGAGDSPVGSLARGALAAFPAFHA